MNLKDLELKLLAGLPIEIQDVGSLYIPTLKEIISLGESRYNHLVSALLFDKKDQQNLKDLNGTNFEFLLFYCHYYPNEELSRDFIESLELHFKDKVSISEEDGFFYLGDYQERRLIDEDNFEFIRDVVRKANHIRSPEEEEEEGYNPANETAAQFIKELEEKKKKRPKPKETINLHSIISGLAWKPNGINLKEIFDLTIYQIYNGFAATENIDNYHYTMSGIYAGTVDGKKIKPETIHWARVLKQK
jgi:hypothetical protein